MSEVNGRLTVVLDEVAERSTTMVGRYSAEMARALAVAAIGVLAVVDPEAIVLGGENIDLVRAVDPEFEQALREATVPAQHGLVIRELSTEFDQWARGAAVLAIQEFVGP